MNEEFVVAPKRNRRKIIKIFCAVLVCLLCFSLGVGGGVGWFYYVTGELGAKINGRITVTDICLDGKRVEGTVEGRYLYYTLDNDSLYDLYHKETIIKKQDASGEKTIKKIKGGAGPIEQPKADVVAFQKEELRLYLDLWEITEEGTYCFSIKFKAKLGEFYQDVSVVITVDIPAAS